MRRALYSRLRWLWPLLAAPAVRRAARLALWGLIGAWLVFAALVLVLRYAVLPGIAGYQAEIERELTRVVGQPVRIGSVEARWQGLNPDLVLDDVVIADRQGAAAFSLAQVEAVLSWESLWRGRLTLGLLAFDRPVLHVRRETDGRITVAGVEAEEEGDPAFAEWVLAQKRIRIRNATIVWEDRLRQAPPLYLEDLQFGLDNSGRRHRFGLSAAPPAELAARVDVRGEIEGDLGEALEHLAGRIFVQLDYADLAGWRAWVDYPLQLPQGRGAVRVWGDLAAGQGKLTADLALEEVRMRLGGKLPELNLESLRGRLEGRYKPGDWALTARKLELLTRDGVRVAPTDFHVEWRQDAATGVITGNASASFVDLAALGRLASHLPLDQHSRDLLVRHQPQGRISELRTSWRQVGEELQSYALKANFADLGIRPGGYFPGAGGLSGMVQLTEKGGELALDSKASSLSLPAVFPEPDTALDLLRGHATWKVAGAAIEVKLDRLQFEGPAADGAASGSYRFTGDGPGEIDLAATISRADGRAVWRYLPYAVGAGARDWVRTGIAGGKAHDGKLVLKGNLADFPFRDPAKGSFLVTAKATGARVDYASGWPVIEDVDADMSFGVGLRVVSEKAGILGVKLSGVVVELPDFESMDEVLKVRGQAKGPTDDFLRFIEESPVSATIDHFTRGMKAQGNGSLDLTLDLPLRRLGDTRLRGDYQFQNNQLELLAGLPPLTKVNGRLALTEKSVSAQEINGQVFGGPLKVQVRSAAGQVVVEAGGRADVGEVASHFALPAKERLDGTAAWKSDISIRRRNADFVVESDLVGVSSRFPEPLAKDAGAALALRVERMALDAEREQYRVALGSVANGTLVNGPKGIERAVVALGEGDARLPEKGIAVRIALPRLDADAWKGVLPAGDAGGGAPSAAALDLVSIKTPSLRLFDRDFTQVDTAMRPRQGGWQISVNMREAAGDVFWHSAGDGSLDGRLQRLVVLPAITTVKRDFDLINALPAMNLVVDDFAVGERHLGRLEVRARNEKGAWRMETLSLANPDGNLNAKALWRNSPRHQSRLDFELAASDVGKLLDRLGYGEVVRRGTATLTGDLQWDGPLTAIDYASLTGNLMVEARKGQFSKLDPGVGKLLGLLSLQSLPRRLTLDFGDIFSEGLAFDTIDGKMDVKSGIMRTSGPLRIASPAAQIEIQGETDLKKETQDLRVMVRPFVGGAAAAAGAATLINPLLGAAALVAGAILQNPISHLFSYSYHVTGTWADPKVENIGKAAVETAPAAMEGNKQ